MLLRIAAFLLAVFMVVTALPATRRADRASAEGWPRLRVLYESARAILAIAAATVLCCWILFGA